METKTYFKVYGALMILTLATVGISFINLGIFGTPAALAIAAGKAALVLLFFMHLLHRDHLTWVFALGGSLWLALIVGGTVSDVLTRTAVP